MRIALGCDHAGVSLKVALAELASSLGHSIQDCGTDGTASVDYPDFAAKVGELVVAGKADKGILVCGTGIGMSIAANKISGIRAALCNTEFEATMCRRHNDANVLCLGARVLGVGLAESVVRAYLSADFEGGRHAGRVAKLRKLDEKGTP